MPGAIPGIVRSMFNLNHPEGYKDRSLSVSDVVEVMEDPMHPHCFYFCDSVGFKPIDFEPKDCQLGRTFTDTEKKNMISVLLVEPNKYPKMIEIEALQIILSDRYEVIDSPPKFGKDFNDFLCMKLGIYKSKQRSFER